MILLSLSDQAFIYVCISSEAASVYIMAATCCMSSGGFVFGVFLLSDDDTANSGPSVGQAQHVISDWLLVDAHY